jgi:hypothetical protein
LNFARVSKKPPHIEPRRGTLKKFKNGGKCLLNFLKINLSDLNHLYLNKFNKKHLKKLFYTKKSRRFTLRRNIYFIQNINIFKILSLLKFMQGFN